METFAEDVSVRSEAQIAETAVAAPSPERSRWIFDSDLPWNRHNARFAALVRLGVMIAAGATVVAACLLLTPLRSPRDVLAERTWGIGRTSTSVMTAFALGNPWWRRHSPSGLVRDESGAVPPEVRVARSEIDEIADLTTVPHRSVGYDAILGWLTAIRSLGSSDLVFDWWAIVRFQQAALVLATLAPLLAVVAAARTRSRPWVAGAYACGFAFLLATRPFENAWLIDGIIDSALAAPAALIGVPLLAFIAAASEEYDRSRVWKCAASGLVLGLFTMIRGELAIVFLLGLIVVALWSLRPPTVNARLGSDLAERGWTRIIRPLVPAVVSGACLLSIPVAYGLVNVAVHGHFVPFRLQSGQNLVEPVGEFENPWGIEYSDEWMNADLKAMGIDYISFEADSVLTRRYVGMVAQEPRLFLRNFSTRLGRLPETLAFGHIGPLSLPFLLIVAIGLGRRYPRCRAALVPLVLSLGFVLFHAWFGSPGRVLAPVRFLMVAALCAAGATATGIVVETLRNGVAIPGARRRRARGECGMYAE